MVVMQALFWVAYKANTTGENSTIVITSLSL